MTLGRATVNASGFSLIEVVVALAVISILVAVTSRGLMTSLSSDEVSAQIFAGTLALNRVEAAAVRDAPREELERLAGPDWIFADARPKTADRTNAPAWRLLSLRSTLRPSLVVQAAMRHGNAHAGDRTAAAP